MTGDIEGRIREGLSDPEGNAVLVRELWHWPSQKSAYYGMTFHLDGQGRDVSIELITDTNPSHIADWTRVFLFNCLLRFGGGDVLLDSGVLVL